MSSSPPFHYGMTIKTTADATPEDIRKLINQWNIIRDLHSANKNNNVKFTQPRGSKSLIQLLNIDKEKKIDNGLGIRPEEILL